MSSLPAGSLPSGSGGAEAAVSISRQKPGSVASTLTHANPISLAALCYDSLQHCHEGTNACSPSANPCRLDYVSCSTGAAMSGRGSASNATVLVPQGAMDPIYVYFCPLDYPTGAAPAGSGGALSQNRKLYLWLTLYL